MSQIRRRGIGNKKGLNALHDIYKDVVFNKRLYSNDISNVASGSSLYNKIFITDKVPVIAGHVLKVHHGMRTAAGDNAIHACHLFNDDAFVGWWGNRRQSDPFTFTVNDNVNSAIFSAILVDMTLDDFYVLDTTDNVYIYRGKNVK